MVLKNHKIFIPAVWLSLFVAIYVYCRQFLSYNYYFVEQFTFFRFSKEYAVSTLGQLGGLSDYIADFLTQFYIYPEIGPLLAAFLGVLLTALLDSSLKVLNPNHYIPFVSALPALACLWLETDFNYYLSGTVSLILITGIFFLYVKSMRGTGLFLRLLLLALLSWPIHYLLGPHSVLLVSICVLAELKGDNKKRYFSLLTLPFAVIPPYYFYLKGLGGELINLLLPSGYYVSKLPVGLNCYLPWIFIFINIVLALTVLRPRSNSEPNESFLAKLLHSLPILALQFISVIFLMHWGTLKYNSASNYEAKVFDYYTRTGEWQKLLQDPHLRANQNFMHACYQNLALSSLNQLGDKLLSYPQIGLPGLLIRWNRTTNSSMLLSDVYWQIGDVALAQEMAFEGMIASRKGVNPRLLMRLVQTNLVMGNYLVAEKYIDLLSDTYFYASKAEGYRKMLYHDEAVLADAELGPRKLCTQQSKGLTNTDWAFDDLALIMNNNPKFEPVFHFYGSVCLLAKDVNSFKKFVEQYHTSPALQPMPVHFQEAIILSYEGEKGRWAELGVTPSVLARFEQYRDVVLHSSNPSVLQRKLAGTFSNTYWYYFMFKK